MSYVNKDPTSALIYRNLELLCHVIGDGTTFIHDYGSNFGPVKKLMPANAYEQKLVTVLNLIFWPTLLNMYEISVIIKTYRNLGVEDATEKAGVPVAGG